MSLNWTDILTILETTEDDLSAKIKKSGRTYIESRIKIIEKALLDKKYFGEDLVIEEKHLTQNVRKMFGKNRPVSIAITKTTGEQFNMSVDSVDMNVSSMSYKELGTDVQSDLLIKKSKKELVRQLKLAEEKILAQDTELENLRPLGNFFMCEKNV